MRLWTLIRKELWERPVPMLTCLLAILLGVTALVAIRTVTVFSELAVAREMDSLGANVLILPKGVSVQDYYAADMHGETLPEEYVERITLSKLEGVDNLSPKLCVPATLGGRQVTLTGILPRSEFQAKAAWGGAGVFARPIGCGAHADLPDSKPADPKALARKRVIETLGDHEDARRGRRRRPARDQGRRHRRAAGRRRSPSWPSCRRPARWTTPASSPTCTRCRSSPARARWSTSSRSSAAASRSPPGWWTA